MDNLIGKRLDGRYQIESLVGMGGMANVYRGTDTKTGNAIAVKVLKEEFLDNEELVRRFKNESKAISILSHPNIVKVYDVSVTDRLQYIVMEYVDGITLKEYLKQRGGALTWKETVHFATQVLSALQHAHSKGIIHRDVKPQNIMLLADGSIKMMDFGIARFSRAQSQTVSDKAIGSVHYISPEQAKGDKTDARTDIYSVGVMLYEMLSGKLPFDGDGAVSIAIMQISDKAKPLAQVAPNVPEALCQITEKAMEKDPANRYQSAQEMLEAIEAFKRNPSARFAYEYRNAQDNPERNINRVVNSTKPTAKSAAGAKAAAKSGSNIRTGDARRVGTQNPGRSKKSKKKKSQKPFSLLPIFFGMAVAFVIGAAILIYLIFTNSSNLLFSNRNDVTLISFIGMTEDEFRASEYNSLLKLQKEEEYSDEPAGTIVKQNPKAGRTVKEGQKITLTVSLGTQYVTIPETKNMVAEDAEQTLKDMGLRVTKKPMVDSTVAPG
ncbi:MAG: Stk1 family PASTA domain-containing Ser/Thr kinase, partial [Gemmiger sp.]